MDTYQTRRRLTDAKQTFYAVQWWFALSNAEVRLSHESLKGYGRQRHTRTVDPVLLESTMGAPQERDRFRTFYDSSEAKEV